MAPLPQAVAPQAAAAPAADVGHVEAGAAAAAGRNKRCPCPNCKGPAVTGAKPAPAPPVAPPKSAIKGGGSFASNVYVGGISPAAHAVAQAPKQQAAPAKQQQQRQAQGQAQGQRKGERKAERKPTFTFNARALPAKPLLAAPGAKELPGAGAKPKPKRDSFKVQLQKLGARLRKSKKE